MTGTESGSIVFVDKGKASISAMLNTEHGLKERIDFCFMRTINISYCVFIKHLLIQKFIINNFEFKLKSLNKCKNMPRWQRYR